MEINQYPLESFAFQDNDYYDIDFWTGSGYQTKKILGSTIKAGILAAVENIYTASGVITGDRQIGLGGNNLNFLSSDAGASFTINLDDLGTTSNSQFLQTLSQIYLSIIDVTTPDKDVQFDINTTNTQLVLNDGAGNSSSLQISGVGSALNFSDGITNYRVEANENGVIINTSYSLPATDGTAGQVMTTDGAGVVSWQDNAASGVNIYNTDGTLTAQRIVDLNAQGIYFQDSSVGGSQFVVNIDNGTTLSAFTLQPNIFDLESLNLALGSVITGTPTSLLLKYIGSSGIKQMQINNGGLRINGQYYLPNIDGTAGQVVRTDGAGNLSFQSLPVEVQVAASDEITPLTLGNGKVTFRMPHGMTLTEVRASLTTAQVSGAIFTVDVIQNGVSVLSTKCTIDNTERTSTSATTLPVIAVSALADDAEIRVDITQIGDGTANGLKVTLIGTRQ